MFVSNHVVFLEKEFLLREDSGSKVEISEVQDALTDVSHLTKPEAVIHNDEFIADSSKTQVCRRTSRIRSILDRYGFLISEQKDVLFVENDEPATYEESLNSSESDQWLKTMKLEMDSMYTNQVWTLVDPPEGIEPIGCKWIFKKKTNMEGNVITYKARLVAKGYRKKQGIDYDKTSSLVAMLKSIRILLAIVALYDYEIWQMDVKITFSMPRFPARPEWRIRTEFGTRDHVLGLFETLVYPSLIIYQNHIQKSKIKLPP